ncbi:MAG: hypothetical protein OXB98_03840 [Bryobacterales bacterium]|nr:hypothetical protein [Bryobacterales bacterium]
MTKSIYLRYSVQRLDQFGSAATVGRHSIAEVLPGNTEIVDALALQRACH